MALVEEGLDHRHRGVDDPVHILRCNIVCRRKHDVVSINAVGGSGTRIYADVERRLHAYGDVSDCALRNELQPVKATPTWIGELT